MKQQQVPLPLHSRKTGKKGSFSSVLAQAQKTKGQNVTAGDSYVIRPGDTLYSISNRLKKEHNLSQSSTQLVKDLTVMNRLSNPNLIVSGKTLRVPFSLRDRANAVDARVDHSADKTSNAHQPAIPQRNGGAKEVDVPPALSNRQGFAVKAPFETEETLKGTPSMPNEKGPVLAASLAPAAKTSSDPATQMAMYKEDQLLAHPGGDNYFLNRADKVYDPAYDQSKFVNRIGKDLSDTGENLLNIARDLSMGSQFKYVGKDGEVMEGKREGLLGTLKNFFEDLISGLSFGAYVPANEKAPVGVGASIRHFVKKVFYEAPVKDFLVGVPHAAMNIVKDAAFAAINVLEVVPDATIGNFDWGQKLTTTIFDNGQVAVDYLTDVVPGGNAWLRVHAAGANGELASPVFYNLHAPEQGVTDSRWATVRNTPFRKTIETVGSLLCDAVTIMSLTTEFHTSSSDHDRT